MFTVAVLAQKGGVGKTTVTLSLAFEAMSAGARTGVIDADPQASSSGWAIKRQSQGRATPVVAAAVDPTTLRSAVADARDDEFEWLFIDTPPAASEIQVTAAQLADFLLIPCLPSALVMDAMGPTVKIAQRTGKPAFFLVNFGRSKGINNECAVALTSAYGLPAANTHLARRQPIADALDIGLALREWPAKDKSVTNGQEEFSALWTWLNRQQQNRAPANERGVNAHG